MRLFSLGVLPKTPMTCVILDASTSGLFREEATGGESQAFWQEQEHWVGNAWKRCAWVLTTWAAVERRAASFSICLGFVESTPNGRNSTQELESKPKNENRSSRFISLWEIV